MLDLTGTSSVVTGGASGIGEAAARQLPHLQRIASLVEPRHITCEPPARRSELGVILFTDEAAAVAWLSA
jgi:NAD(P)-dependent dehydrogenase (short-subunit alcohol dehydrogenase family)